MHVETDNSYEIIEKRLLLKINDTINTAWAHLFKKCFKVSIVYEGTEKRCKTYVEKLKLNEKMTRMFVDSTNCHKSSTASYGENSNDYDSMNSFSDYVEFKKGINSSSTFNDILRQSTYLLNELSEKSASLSNKISSISTPSKFSKNTSVVNDTEYKTVKNLRFFSQL